MTKTLGNLCRRRAALLLPLAAILSGCAQTTPPENWPKPSFAGPAYAAPSAPAPQQSATVNGIPRAWIPYTQPRAWKWIVIHHSASKVGSAAIFDREHRKKWDELGYHFVIGNGSASGDGQIEVGPRWPKQKWGAHAGIPEYNDRGIGICLVGDFDKSRPSAAQVQALTQLVAYLEKTYRIPSSRVLGHDDTGRKTHCPGRYFPLAQVRINAQRALASAGITIPEDTAPPTLLANKELLTPNTH